MKYKTLMRIKKSSYLCLQKPEQKLQTFQTFPWSQRKTSREGLSKPGRTAQKQRTYLKPQNKQYEVPHVFKNYQQ